MFAIILPVAIVFALGAFGVEAKAGPNEDIIAASKTGDRAGVEVALSQGASVNAADKDGVKSLGLLPGLTPLSFAAIYGHENVAELLLDRGAKLEVRINFEQTPLHLAARFGSLAVAKLFLDRGADVDARDLFGGTPLTWAVMGGSKGVVALMISRGALVNAQDTLIRNTPLHLAASTGKTGYSVVSSCSRCQCKNSEQRGPNATSGNAGFGAR